MNSDISHTAACVISGSHFDEKSFSGGSKRDSSSEWIGHGKVVGRGKADGLQRFRRKGCGKSSSALTGTRSVAEERVLMASVPSLGTSAFTEEGR